VPSLGDGRAILLGEVVATDGRHRDIQLKGSGPTPYSRRGDGRAALGPVLREYLVAEAFAALGIPTTRALAAVATGERVFRDRPLPGAVLVRVATSHLRVGTLQYHAARGDIASLKRIADEAIARHVPAAIESAAPHRALLEHVVHAQARLVAQWLGVGFLHGVMNTDNCALSGETIDYGPCAFLDAYDPLKVLSSIDRDGRYAFGRQPQILSWNLARCAEALLPLLDADTDRAVEIATEILDDYAPAFWSAHAKVFGPKLGLTTWVESDRELLDEFLSLLAAQSVDYTRAFRALGAAAAGDLCPLRREFADPSLADEWLTRWQARLHEEPMCDRRGLIEAHNPVYIPRNHLVEAAISAAVEEGDYRPFHALRAVLEAPYTERAGLERYAAGPEPHEVVTATFCGT
jgi:serine/tyrosine/threonine adenylyltransferase